MDKRDSALTVHWQKMWCTDWIRAHMGYVWICAVDMKYHLDKAKLETNIAHFQMEPHLYSPSQVSTLSLKSMSS